MIKDRGKKIFEGVKKTNFLNILPSLCLSHSFCTNIAGLWVEISFTIKFFLKVNLKFHLWFKRFFVITYSISNVLELKPEKSFEFNKLFL